MIKLLIVSINPRKIPATKAPWIEPKPPTTTTIKALKLNCEPTVGLMT